MASKYAKTAALREDCTMARDLLIQVRDDMPTVDEGEKSTPNQRRAIRKAIMKSLAVWYTLHEHSNLPEAIVRDRTYRIQRMLAEILSMMRGKPEDDEDAPPADEVAEKGKYLLDGDDK